MLPVYDSKAIGQAAIEDGFTAAMLAEINRVPAKSVMAMFTGAREGVELMDLLRVAGSLGLSMRQLFPWARPEPPRGQVDFEILLKNRKRRWFRVVDNDSNEREVVVTSAAVCAAVGRGV
jgi:hypothetical protein